MNNDGTSYKELSQTDIDPIKPFLGKVIGIATNDGFTIRGRLIKFDFRVLWLEKMSGDTVMIGRSGIDRLWLSRDCKAAV